MGAINSKVVRLSAKISGAATFKYIGGIQSQAFSFDKPVADTTSQSTNPSGTGKFTGSSHTGYMTCTVNGSGLVDTTADTAVLVFTDLLEEFINEIRPVEFQLEDTLGTYAGSFNISKLELNSSEQDKYKFTINAQNDGAVTFTPAV